MAAAEIATGEEVCWATDLNAGGAALLIELLTAHAQRLLYIPGRIVHHAAATYRGDGKTDAKDARIIADQARMRTDLQPVRGGRIDPAGPRVRGADIQPQLPGRGHDAAGPVKDGMELIPLGLGVLALAPDPGSIRPFLAGTPIDAEFLGRRGDRMRAALNGFP